MTSDDDPWLRSSEERLWRDWVAVHSRMMAELNQQLHRDAGLSLAEFEVLVHLTDAAEGRVRVLELSRLLQWERSRVSHQVTRMERRDLVCRHECPDDRRGAFVAITTAGKQAIEQAAPGHVQAVREAFVTPLSEANQEGLRGALDALLASRTPES